MSKDDRLRSPVKSDYTDALGRAVFTFATCEWQVVWCSEKICPGVLRKIVGEELTAGKIAKLFIDLCRNMPKSKEREVLSNAARRFSVLVEERNRILHGKPCTGPNGEARLSGSGVIEINDLENAADAFVECSGELNEIYYGFLQTYTPIT
ncbi:hypothetical protein [Pectobacterium brasiliense]|uniref:hypothetical protein n=1 Tax=Pectobacterium brasiliense TaxID=180957 RepID=UPI0019690E4D|nr:hypothetical protein [Pectobacterium brasiliense]MBN3072349.1 hypothetical protein [Pectobacterium brasiliense]MBN3124047.1 hypothetical protein [Pectobacterium brasiliense]MBN3167989.1 hypothetical protein [Pectobacterium brasiliense]QSD23992.1 hypothetical protein H5A38_06660 [Pectobacterium brasiliense]